MRVKFSREYAISIIQNECREIFVDIDEINKLYVSIRNALDWSLKVIVKSELPKIDVDQNDFFVLLGCLKNNPCIPKLFMNFLSQYKTFGNIDAHGILDPHLRGLAISSSRSALYTYLVWFFKQYLKADVPEVLKDWDSLNQKIKSREKKNSKQSDPDKEKAQNSMSQILYTELIDQKVIVKQLTSELKSYKEQQIYTYLETHSIQEIKKFILALKENKSQRDEFKMFLDILLSNMTGNSFYGNKLDPIGLTRFGGRKWGNFELVSDKLSGKFTEEEFLKCLEYILKIREMKVLDSKYWEIDLERASTPDWNIIKQARIKKQLNDIKLEYAEYVEYVRKFQL